jgi:hypothetical protein
VSNHLNQKEINMRKVNFAVLAGLVAIAVVAVSTVASARRGAGDGTYCKSGQYVKNAKACKENGGTR